jgi:hypothetical protein
MNCKNCYINYSPMWRKNYCNACATHYSRHGYHKNVCVIYAKILMDIKNNK